MQDDPRYAPVEAALPAVLPAITRMEAERAAKALFRKFGGVQHGSVDMTRPVKFRRVRTCWLSPKDTAGHHKGWGRLIHDVSHDIYSARCPRLPPHHSGHSKLEAELAQYVVDQGWLAGALRPPVPTLNEKRALELKGVEARISQWLTKLSRATTALKDLEQRRKRLIQS